MDQNGISARSHPIRSLWLVAILVLAFGSQPAFATTVYGDFNGDNFDYLGVQETSSFGDPEPLFGAPTILGDALLFTPLSFSASAAGAFGLDQTGAQLQTTIMATGAGPIDVITIDEFLDVDLSGPDSSTGVLITMAGVVTVLETTDGPVCTTPGDDSCQIDFTGIFTPNSDGLFLSPADNGLTQVQGSVFVDVGAVIPNATKAFLSFDNDLLASSGAGGTSLVTKKPTIVVTVIPEPSTFFLLAGGLLGLTMRARSRRV